MASIYKELQLSSSPDAVWDVVRDVGAVHTRFAPGFVTDTVMDGEGERVVTFANGFVAREAIVTIDEARRRLAYSARSGRIAHHNASFQVRPQGQGTTLVWTADVLPDAVAPTIEGMMDDGLKAISRGIDGVGV